MKNRIYWAIERTLLLLVSFVVLFPIFWMFLTSLKKPRDAYSITLNFQPTLENFATVFADPWNLGSMVLNSVIVAGVTVLIAVPCASLAAYSFSRFRVKGRKILFFLVLSTQFIPAVVIVLPFFLMFRSLGLLDTRIALIIVNLAIVTPFVIWMIKGFIDAIPVDSEEAALIDGASRLRVIRDIVLPMAAPGILTSSIFCFILTWNEFLFSLILTRRDAVTLAQRVVDQQTWGPTHGTMLTYEGVQIFQKGRAPAAVYGVDAALVKHVPRFNELLHPGKRNHRLLRFLRPNGKQCAYAQVDRWGAGMAVPSATAGAPKAAAPPAATAPRPSKPKAPAAARAKGACGKAPKAKAASKPAKAGATKPAPGKAAKADGKGATRTIAKAPKPKLVPKPEPAAPAVEVVEDAAARMRAWRGARREDATRDPVGHASRSEDVAACIVLSVVTG